MEQRIITQRRQELIPFYLQAVTKVSQVEAYGTLLTRHRLVVEVENFPTQSSSFAITVVSGNWRLTFAFEGEDAILVDYQDYH
jgi:hypothetical protein